METREELVGETEKLRCRTEEMEEDRECKQFDVRPNHHWISELTITTQEHLACFCLYYRTLLS